MTTRKELLERLEKNTSALVGTLLTVLEGAFAIAAWAAVILIPLGIWRNAVGGTTLRLGGFVRRIRYTSRQVRTAITVMLVSIPVFEAILIIAKWFGHIMHGITASLNHQGWAWMPVMHVGTPAAILGMLIILALIVAFIFRGGDAATLALAGGFFGRKRKIVLRVHDQQPNVPVVNVNANLNSPLSAVSAANVPVKLKWESVRAPERGPLAFLMIYVMVLGCITGLVYILPVEANLGLAALSNIGWMVWILAAWVMEVLDLNWYRTIGKPAFYLMMVLPMVWMFTSMIMGLDNPMSLPSRIFRTQKYEAEHSEVVQQWTTTSKSVLKDTVVVIPAGAPQSIMLNGGDGKVTSYRVTNVVGTICWDRESGLCSGPAGASYSPEQTAAVDHFATYHFSSREDALNSFFAREAMGSAICSQDGGMWRSCIGFSGNGNSLVIENANQRRADTANDSGSRTYKIEYTVERRYEVTPNGDLALVKF